MRQAYLKEKTQFIHPWLFFFANVLKKNVPQHHSETPPVAQNSTPLYPRLFSCVSRNSFLCILFSLCKLTRNILIFFVLRTSLTLATTLKICFRKTFAWYHTYVTLLHNRAIFLLHHPRHCLLHPTPLCPLFNGLKGKWKVHILQKLGSQCLQLVYRLRA